MLERLLLIFLAFTVHALIAHAHVLTGYTRDNYSTYDTSSVDKGEYCMQRHTQSIASTVTCARVASRT